MTGFLCFLLFAVGALMAVLSGFSKRHRRGVEVTGHLLMSSAFFIYAAVSSHILRIAPRPVATGVVISERLARSRMDTNLITVLRDGGAGKLTLDSELSAQQIQVGERVRVTYSESDYGLLELDVLSGPGTGFVLREDDRAGYKLVFALGGIIFLGTAWMSWKKGRTALI